MLNVGNVHKIVYTLKCVQKKIYWFAIVLRILAKRLHRKNTMSEMKCHREFEINLNTGVSFYHLTPKKELYDFEKPLAWSVFCLFFFGRAKENAMW